MFVPVNLKGLVRVPYGGVALNAYAMGGANAKREQTATKSTPAGCASDDAVAFCDEVSELKLEFWVPSGIVRPNDDADV